MPTRRDDTHAALLHNQHTKFLRHQITSEPARIFNDDQPDAVALDPIQHRGEARSGLNRIGARYRSVVKLSDQFDVVCLGVGFDCRPLADIAVASNVRSAACAEVCEGVCHGVNPCPGGYVGCYLFRLSTFF